MKKYANIIDHDRKSVQVGIGTNTAFYKSIGMTEMEVEQGYDGQWYVAGYAPKQPLEEAKSIKLQEINAGFEQTTQRIVATYPQSELLTFDQQTQEAEAYLADPTADCPMLAPLAAARGITMEDLCQRVMAKHAAFSAATGLLMGQRQAMEDRLELAETVEDVKAIEVAYSLPGAEVA